MPYHMKWFVQKRVILTQFWGNVTRDDILQFISELEGKIEEGTPLIHHISDGLEIEKLNIDLKTLQLMLKSMKPSETMGWHIEVTRSPINRMIGAIANQFAKIRFRTYNTVQEAVDFLLIGDDTLRKSDFETELD